MTVYRDVDAARIDPAILNKQSAIPAPLRSWFDEVHHLQRNPDQSIAFKAGYYYGVLKLIEEYFEAQAQDQG
jgi:hypothetical protein